jgi:hypothetical protein
MPSRDYEEFIAALDAHSVRYLIVGAHAVAFHGRPRATKDLDVLVEGTPANAAHLLAAMREFFGDADLGCTVEDLTDPETIIQLGAAPVRIDLLARIAGCADFEAAWANRVEGSFGPIAAHYLSLDDLIRSKEAADRDQDRADVRALRRAKEPRRGRRPKPRRS